MWSGLVKLLGTLAEWALGAWRKKHAPTAAQRSDQIAADYHRKRDDLAQR